MISFKEARDLIVTKVAFCGTEEVSLEDAFGRVLANDIFAPRDFPPFNRSAMDGIAVRFEDLEKGISNFKCVETVFAGSSFSKEIHAGQCYKIMTGAAVPSFTNVVIRVEDTSEADGNIKIVADEFKLYQNIALQGQDLKKGELAIAKHTEITAGIVGLLASMGKSQVQVQKMPSVNIITTGNEVLELDQEISPIHIYNSNKYVLKSLLQQNHLKATSCIHVKDDRFALKQEINRCLNTDVLILTGGVSAGEADFIPAILEELGVKKLFYKVAIKPGKPVWCGKRGETMVFALPGNPFSCMVTFKLFVEFYIKACLGLKPDTFESLPLDFERIKKSTLDEFFPVNIKNGRLTQIAINGSGDVRLGMSANTLAMQKADDKRVERGSFCSLY
ncbi:MAG TPA: molybdopterin molybdotransferase MoeA [Pelobium sp.]|nr:molybdopterin molybdotransferase MoeA [Pelobium sp.]